MFSGEILQLKWTLISLHLNCMKNKIIVYNNEV